MGGLHKLTILGDDLIEKPVDITDKYRVQIDQFKSKIDLSNASVMQYGIVAQNQLGTFSDMVLKQMRLKTGIGVDSTLGSLIFELEHFNKSISRWSIFRLFESNRMRIIRINNEYKKIEKTIVGIERQLEQHYQTLSVDLKLLEKMFEQNKLHFESLSLYIYAGELKSEEINNEILPRLQREALEKQDNDLQQAARNMEEQLARLDKRMHNLKLSKVVSMQLASQIRLVQSNNASLLDRLQSCMLNTLPLWRNQMILSLNVANTQQILEAQHYLSKFINKVMRRSSKALRKSGSQIARENEREIINLSTLQHLNKDLLATVYDVLEVQQEARYLRGQAETSLLMVEKELAQLVGE